MANYNVIHIGADHGGYPLAGEIISYLKNTARRPVVYHGNYELDPEDDFPVYAKKVTLAVAKQTRAIGILLCFTGAGMCVVANKFPRVYAAEVSSIEEAKQAKIRLKANLITLGGNNLYPHLAIQIINAWLKAKPSRAQKYLRRQAIINEIENQNFKI